MKFHLLLFVLSFFLTSSQLDAKVERIWLSFPDEAAERIAIQWETSERTLSRLRIAPQDMEWVLVEDAELKVRHSIEVPIPKRDVEYQYQIWDGKEWMAAESFKALPTKHLSLALIANLGYAKERSLDQILKDDPHVLLSGGDNVPSLHEKGRIAQDAYRAVIDENPKLFRRIPFMPILGNHDHEIKPRGQIKYPKEAVYDIDAQSFRDFFVLPGKEWIWELNFKEFNLRLLGLALHHLSDHGTTWQSASAWDENSEQFRWYQDRLATDAPAFTLTLINENIRFADSSKNAHWKSAFLKSQAVISGFGYFGERALIGSSLPYYNTSLKADGDLYQHPKSEFVTRINHYLYLSVEREAPSVKVEFRALKDGQVLEASWIPQASNP